MFPSKIFTSAILLSSALFACGGGIVPIGEHDDKIVAGEEPGEGTGEHGGGYVSGGGQLPSCDTPTGAIHTFTSIADTEARLGGTWLLCTGAITSPTDTAGIAFGTGTASFLVTSGGSLVQGTGRDYQRTVSILDTTSMNGPGSYQVNLEVERSFNTYAPRTSEDGRFLELNEGTSGKQARYVRVETQPSACAISGTPHAYTSSLDVIRSIEGSWEVCSGGITSPNDTRGLEFAAGTQDALAANAYFLVASGDALQRGAGWDYERTVSIHDTSAMNGAGSYQINLETGSGANMYRSRVSEAGDVLELDEGTSGKKVVYRRVR